jgi:hypothetical protein
MGSVTGSTDPIAAIQSQYNAYFNSQGMPQLTSQPAAPASAFPTPTPAPISGSGNLGQAYPGAQHAPAEPDQIQTTHRLDQRKPPRRHAMHVFAAVINIAISSLHTISVQFVF